MESTAQNVAARLLADGEAAGILAEALDEFGKVPPATIARNAVESEKKCFVPWLRHEAASSWTPEEAKRFADLFVRSTSKEAAEQIGRLQQPEMLKLLDGLEEQYNEIAAAFGLPYAEFQAKAPALEEKLKASKNPLAALNSAIFPRTRVELEANGVRWAMLRAGIEYRLSGEAALAKITDPHDGRPFQFKALEGNAFELKSAMTRYGRPDEPITMSFGRAAAK
jgi:hypothetical protein